MELSKAVFSQVEWSIISLKGETMNSFKKTFYNATTIYNDGPAALSGLTAIALVTVKMYMLLHHLKMYHQMVLLSLEM